MAPVVPEAAMARGAGDDETVTASPAFRQPASRATGRGDTYAKPPVMTTRSALCFSSNRAVILGNAAPQPAIAVAPRAQTTKTSAFGWSGRLAVRRVSPETTFSIPVAARSPAASMCVDSEVQRLAPVIGRGGERDSRYVHGRSTLDRHR